MEDSSLLSPAFLGADRWLSQQQKDVTIIIIWFSTSRKSLEQNAAGPAMKSLFLDAWHIQKAPFWKDCSQSPDNSNGQPARRAVMREIPEEKRTKAGSLFSCTRKDVMFSLMR